MDNTRDLIEAAWAARREGRLDEAERGLREAIEASRRSSNQPQLVDALGKLAHVLRDLGWSDEALPPSEEAVRIGRGVGEPQLLAHAVRHLGDLHRDCGRFADASRCYDEALALYRGVASPDALEFANALRSAALLKASQGARPEARALFEEARVLYQQAGIAAGVEDCARQLAGLE
jgi:tetratricopeptide (TPR) repeat protein